MMGDDDVYGDTDPDDGDDAADPPAAAQAAAVDTDGPGVALAGSPGWRAGAFSSGRGLLGLTRVSNPAPIGGGQSDLPPGYVYGPDGKLQLDPNFKKGHPTGPFDFGGMAQEIHWPGVAKDLGKIAAGVGIGMLGGLLGPVGVGPAGSGALPNPWITGGSLAWRGGRTLYRQQKANTSPPKGDRGKMDRASEGLP